MRGWSGWFVPVGLSLVEPGARLFMSLRTCNCPGVEGFAMKRWCGAHIPVRHTGLSGLKCGSSLRWEVQLIVESIRFKRPQLEDPEVFTSEEQIPHLLLGEVLFGYFLDDDQAKIAVEVMVWLVEVAVDGYAVRSAHIIAVLVHPFVCPLGLHFSNILAVIALHTESKVDGVLRSTVGAVSDFILGFAGSIGEEGGVYQMSAAHAVCSSHAWAASPLAGCLLSNCPALAKPRLSYFVTKAPVLLIT